MLLVMWHSQTRQVYLARQTPDFRFNRLDSSASSEYQYGRKWITQNRYLLGLKEWTQVGPLNMVQWSN